jgi:hypothetical protein
MAKIYSVKWEDGDGEQGYFVKMSAAAAKKLDAFLKEEETKGVIKDPDVSAIEGDWLLTPKQFHHEFKERYRSP